MKTEVGESIKELSKKAVKAMSSLEALNYSRAVLTLSRALELIERRESADNMAERVRF